MNTDEIHEILKRYKGRFLGVFPLDEIPDLTRFKTQKALIFNEDPAGKPGTHWMALFLMPRGGEPTVQYFDSYGRPPVLKFPGFKVRYNKFRLQSFFSIVCGQFCIYFVHQRLRGKSFSAIISTLRKKRRPDEFVANYVKKVFGRQSLPIRRGCQCAKTFCPT